MVDTPPEQPSQPTNHSAWGVDHNPPLGQPWGEADPNTAPGQDQHKHISGWGGLHPSPLHQWGTTPTPSVATDDQVSGSLSLSLLARGEPFVEEDQECTAADRVTQTATDGICIFAEWATALPKDEFVKTYAQLTQARKDPIMLKHTTQEAFTFRLAIQLVTPFTSWFRATKAANETQRGNHKCLVFADAREKSNA